VMQACILERSDRARALLYHVLYENRKKHGQEFLAAFDSFKKKFDSMKAFQFTEKELNLKRITPRLSALEKVLKPPMKSTVSSGG
jgi:hypothetical protein